MSASDMLKAKFHSDRQLAIYLQHGFNSTIQVSGEIASDIYAGLERVSWYSSCLIPAYHNICQELFTEDKRMLLSIKSLYKYSDAILFMIKLYLTSIIDDSKNNNEQSKIREVDQKTAGILGKHATGKATRAALVLATSKALAESEFVSSAVAQRLSKRLPIFVAALQTLGLEQHSAMAARRLKSLDPNYYFLLYALELEMLYYYVEPVIVKIIMATLHNYNIKIDELMEIIKREFNV